MTQDGWRKVVEFAARHPDAQSLLVRLLFEQDKAKNDLRELGYGCIGMPWARVVEEIARDRRGCGAQGCD